MDIRINLLSLFIGAIITFIFSWKRIDPLYSLVLFFIINGFIEILLKNYNLMESIYTIFSYIYGVFLLSLLGFTNERLLIISAFIIAFSTDTFAYLIGSIFGKHKLIPRISPNKSIEGAIGGSFFGLLITMIYFYYIHKHYISLNINWITIVIVLMASVSGQFGDLFASKIKRTTGVKDFANVLPGHGGILDRFDSIIFVSPFVYILFYLL